MDSTRQKKISKLIQIEISDIFLKEFRDILNIALVTPTIVRISPDLSIAKIYLSTFPTEKTKEIFERLDQNKSKLRMLLGKRIGSQVRIIPDLKFFADDSLDYLENIDNLLK